MLTYKAFAFRQNSNSPIQLTFVASTADLDRWCKIPTRMSNKPMGFQRPEIKNHIVDIQNFFKDSSLQNCSPTSILIGMEPKSVSVRLKDDAGTLISDSSIGKVPVLCGVEIDFVPWDHSPYADHIVDEVAALWDKVRDRITLDASKDAQSDEEDSDIDESPSDSDAAVDSVFEVESDESESQVRLLTASKIYEICESKAYANWPEADLDSLIELLKDETKPGLIIDGQHRLKGTKNDEERPFAVSFLPFAGWSELAFQFIVNNSSAKKVDDNLLFGIVGETLSPEDLAPVQQRLVRAGIKVSLIRAAMRVHSEYNPFYGMLKTNSEGEKGFLDATAMQKKVIELWYGTTGKTGTKSKFKKFRAFKEKKTWSMGDLFWKSVEGANAEEKAKNWQQDTWFKYFSAFWEAVSEAYTPALWPSSKAQWPPSSGFGESLNPDQKQRQQLMRATVLGILQTALLQVWADQRGKELKKQEKSPKDEYISPEDFKKEIKAYIKPLTGDFFSSLTYTGFDASKQLREELSQYMSAVLDEVKTVAAIKQNERFWK